MEVRKNPQRPRSTSCIYILESPAILIHKRATVLLHHFQGAAAVKWRPNHKGNICFQGGGLRNQNTFLTCLPPQTKVARIAAESQRGGLLKSVRQRRACVPRSSSSRRKRRWGSELTKAEVRKRGGGARRQQQQRGKGEGGPSL